MLPLAPLVQLCHSGHLAEGTSAMTLLGQGKRASGREEHGLGASSMAGD